MGAACGYAELNCATVAWMYFFAQTRNQDAWREALYSDRSLLNTYESMFGNPWLTAQQYSSLFTPGMEQPELDLPFEDGIVWSYTSGPHAAWGAVDVRAALDFARPRTRRAACQTALGLQPPRLGLWSVRITARSWWIWTETETKKPAGISCTCTWGQRTA